MVVGEVINSTESAFAGVVLEVGRIGLWMETLGIIVILWIIFQLITFYFSRKRTKALYNFKKDIKRIEMKLNKIENLIKKKNK